jgi:hypothetical protein
VRLSGTPAAHTASGQRTGQSRGAPGARRTIQTRQPTRARRAEWAVEASRSSVSSRSNQARRSIDARPTRSSDGSSRPCISPMKVSHQVVWESISHVKTIRCKKHACQVVQAFQLALQRLVAQEDHCFHHVQEGPYVP